VLDLQTEAGLVPEAAITFVEQHELGDHAYNDMEVGSYLLWRWRGRHRVFQDPRINGYPAAFHAVLKRADVDRATWQALLDEHGVRAALLSYPGQNPRALRFDPQRWALLYRDNDGLVFTRREPSRRALIAARELPLTFTAQADGSIEPLALPAPPAASPVSSCEWQRRLAQHHTVTGALERAEAAYQRALLEPGCLPSDTRAEAQRARAGLALRRGAPAEALAALAGLDDPKARTSRGFALLSLRRASEALAAFESALAGQADAEASADARFGQALALAATGDRAGMTRVLRAFIDRYPHHLAAPAAAARLRQEGAR
jgi:tetratricopeptide (TPR) repeat protein